LVIGPNACHAQQLSWRVHAGGVRRLSLTQTGDTLPLMSLDSCEGTCEACACVARRDVKSSNILLTREGVAKVGDVGLAMMTEYFSSASAATGTFAYAAPEILMGKPATNKARVLTDWGARAQAGRRCLQCGVAHDGSSSCCCDHHESLTNQQSSCHAGQS
jgi:serine/threonine protein kinase